MNAGRTSPAIEWDRARVEATQSASLSSHFGTRTQLLRDSSSVVPAARRMIAVCGDLHNLGDLALLLQNLGDARGRKFLVRQWASLPVGVRRQVERAGGTIVDGRRLLARLVEAHRCDMVIGGGQIVRQNSSLRSLGYLALTALIVRSSGGRVRTRGLGIGETRGLHAWLWRFVLRRADTINVRDGASQARAAVLCPGAAVRLTADMAFWADLAALTDGARGERCIVVALCEDASEERAIDDSRLLNLLREARRRWPDAPIIGAVHDLRPGTDAARLSRLRDLGADLRIAASGDDLGQLLALYRDAAVVLTNRLHAGIFASLYGRPVVVLDDGNDKLAVLHTELSGAVCDLRSPTEPDSAAVLRNATAPSRVAREFRLATVRIKAGRNFDDETRTAIFNVKFSPNLGDGIIAECLESGLVRTEPGLKPRSVDLAGRSGFDPRAGRRRRHFLRLLELLPTYVRKAVMPAVVSAIVRLRLRRRWRDALASCDSAIVGGGALLADADQNFPIKVSNVLDLCGKLQIPVTISHVGVTPHWSRAGRARFQTALSKVRLIGVSVRDERSADSYVTEFGPGRALPRISLDPGLLCCETYGPADAANGTKRIGLCLTDPMVLRLHGGGEVDRELFKKWLRAVIERALRADLEIVLFTNGSPEDETFAEELRSYLHSREVPIPKMARFISPGVLARFIGGLDCIVAHRLHACIAAYSYRVPAIGFSWDKKLDSFFGLVGRERYVVDWRSTGPTEIVALIERALSDSIDSADHAQILDRCREGIADLASKLTAAKAAA